MNKWGSKGRSHYFNIDVTQHSMHSINLIASQAEFHLSVPIEVNGLKRMELYLGFYSQCYKKEETQ